MKQWIGGILAITALLGTFYGGIKWHDQFAQAADMSMVRVQIDLADARRHYYIVYDASSRNPKDMKIQSDLRWADEEVKRLENLLRKLKDRSME